MKKRSPKWMRTTILMKPEQVEKLRTYKKATGLTIGELVGRACERYLEDVVKKAMDEAAREEMGELGHRRRALKLALMSVEREIQDVKTKVLGKIILPDE